MQTDLAKKLGNKKAEDIVGIAEEMDGIEAREKQWTEDRQALLEQIENVKAECADLQANIQEKKSAA